MEEIQLSIIICTYNRSRLLVDALESAIAQKTDFPYEIIVGDDCSTDETRSLLQSYYEKHPDRIVLSLMEKNNGLGANWATALMKARGKYVTFLDDDDYWTDNNRMQIMVDYFEKHHEIDVLYTNGNKYYEHTGRMVPIVVPMPEELDFRLMWKGKQPNLQLDMVMIKKDTLNRCVNLSDYIKYRFPIQDWNTIILLLGHDASFAFMDMPSCVLRIMEGSLSRPVSYEQVEEKFSKEKVMYNYLADQFPNDSIVRHDDEGYDAYVNQILLSVAYKRGDYKKARHYSKLSGGHSLKDKCSRSWLTFHVFRIVRKIIKR